MLVLPLIIPPIFIFGVWVGNMLARKMPFFAQFSRFVAVGFLNTAIDFGTLNILSNVSHVTSGLIIGVVNVPGFLLAVVNSYVWNKMWVFKNQDKKGFFHNFPSFLAVTVIGLVINSGIIVFTTTYVTPTVSNASVWLNIAKAGATVVSLVWNFLGYKFIAFKKGA